MDVLTYSGAVCKITGLKKDRQTVRLMEESCLQKIKVLTQKIPFRNRQTDIVAYRGYLCHQKGSPRVHLINGRLHAISQGPKSRDKKVITF